MSDPGHVETVLDDIQSSFIEQAKAAMRLDRGAPPSAVAFVVCPDHVVTVGLLDLSQRVPVLRKVVAKYGGVGFFLFHDGYVTVPAGDGTFEQRDALLMVQRTVSRSKACALPYHYSPLTGVVFEDVIEAPEVPGEYDSVSFSRVSIEGTSTEPAIGGGMDGAQSA